MPQFAFRWTSAFMLTCATSTWLLACGGKSAPASPSQTWSLSGTVTESPPTANVPIAGATVTIEGGPNSGQTATTNAGGAYSFAGLQQAGFTVRAAAAGYVARSQGVTLASNQTLNFQLNPAVRGFELRCPSAELRLDQSNIASTCTVTSERFGNVVNLGCLNPPAGVSCTFDPNPITVPGAASVPANLSIGPAFTARPGTSAFQVVATGVDGFSQTTGVRLTVTPTCSGFVEQPSYTGNECGTGRGICWGFRDGYVVFTPGEFYGALGYEYSCGEQTVQVVRGSAADYQHVLGTTLLKRAPSTR